MFNCSIHVSDCVRIPSPSLVEFQYLSMTSSTNTGLRGTRAAASVRQRRLRFQNMFSFKGGFAGGSAHARSGWTRTGMQLEGVSATVRPRGALQKTFLSEKKRNAGNTGKTTIAIRHPTQQHVTRSHRSKQHVVYKKCHVQDARCPKGILCVQIAMKQLVEQQSIELIDYASRRRIRRSSKLSTSKQHSVPVRIVRNLRWRDTSAEMPNKCQLQDGTRTGAEADRSVFQLQDAETHPREEAIGNIFSLTGVSS